MLSIPLSWSHLKYSGMHLLSVLHWNICGKQGCFDDGHPTSSELSPQSKMEINKWKIIEIPDSLLGYSDVWATYHHHHHIDRYLECIIFLSMWKILGRMYSMIEGMFCCLAVAASLGIDIRHCLTLSFHLDKGMKTISLVHRRKCTSICLNFHTRSNQFVCRNRTPWCPSSSSYFHRAMWPLCQDLKMNKLPGYFCSILIISEQ